MTSNNNERQNEGHDEGLDQTHHARSVHACSGNVCTIPDGAKWSGRAAARCRDCISPGVNLCEAPPRLLVHQYLNRLDPEDWRGNLLSMQAYLLTQVCSALPGHSQRMQPGGVTQLCDEYC